MEIGGHVQQIRLRKGGLRVTTNRILTGCLIPLLIFVTACGSPKKPVATHPQVSANQSTLCTLTFQMTTGATLQNVLGTVSVSAGGVFEDIVHASGDSEQNSCGTTYTLVEAPESPQTSPFTYWTISGDAGKYNNTVVYGDTLTFTLNGDTTVTANYSK